MLKPYMRLNEKLVGIGATGQSSRSSTRSSAWETNIRVCHVNTVFWSSPHFPSTVFNMWRIQFLLLRTGRTRKTIEQCYVTNIWLHYRGHLLIETGHKFWISNSKFVSSLYQVSYEIWNNVVFLKRRPEFSDLIRMKALQAFNGVYSGLHTTIHFYWQTKRLPDKTI